jgi:uncharacterized protein
VSAAIRTTLAGEAVELLGGRAMYWPARARLLLADLHLGKADAFRRAGIALPSGGTAHDLARLDTLLETTGAGSMWVLGDMLHGAADTLGWRQAWERWRATRARLEIGVLSGNHDRALPAAALDVHLLGAAVDDGPFAFRHAPQRHAALHVVCGHLHPVAVVPGIRRRWPSFWLQPGLTVLPAFSEFTGGVVVAPAGDEALVACVDGSAIPLPGP